MLTVPTSEGFCLRANHRNRVSVTMTAALAGKQLETYWQLNVKKKKNTESGASFGGFTFYAVEVEVLVALHTMP